MASRSEGYLEGYDHAVNDCLQALWVDHRAAAEELVRGILESNKAHHPIQVRKEFLP